MRTCSKTNRKKAQTKTLKLMEKFPCILEQLLLKETSVFLSLAAYTKLSFAFLVSDWQMLVIVKYGSTTTTRNLKQLPEHEVAQERTSQNGCNKHSPFWWMFTQTRKGTEEKKVLFQCARAIFTLYPVAWSCGQPLGARRSSGLFWQTVLDWGSVACWGADHTILCPYNTLRIKSKK